MENKKTNLLRIQTPLIQLLIICFFKGNPIYLKC